MAAPAPSIGALFQGFLIIGLSGFGGALPHARRLIVERRGWLGAAEFAELLGLCQVLPGPNMVNLSVVIGRRFHGAAGAAVAFVGLLAVPMVVVIALGIAYRVAPLPVAAKGAMAGVAAAAAGLMLGTGLRIAAPAWPHAGRLGVAALAFVLLALVHLPLIWVLALAIPVSLLVQRYLVRT